jgi:hypothetical protein
MFMIKLSFYDTIVLAPEYKIQKCNNMFGIINIKKETPSLAAKTSSYINGVPGFLTMDIRKRLRGYR